MSDPHEIAETGKIGFLTPAGYVVWDVKNKTVELKVPEKDPRFQILQLVGGAAAFLNATGGIRELADLRRQVGELLKSSVSPLEALTKQAGAARTSS